MISRRSLLSGLLSLAALGPLGRLMPISHEEDEIHGIDPTKLSGWVNRSEHYGDADAWEYHIPRLIDEATLNSKTAAIRRSMGFKA